MKPSKDVSPTTLQQPHSNVAGNSYFVVCIITEATPVTVVLTPQLQTIDLHIIMMGLMGIWNLHYCFERDAKQLILFSVAD
jgi:hypothetical protein